MQEQHIEMSHSEIEFSVIVDKDISESLVFEELDGLMASNNCGSCHNGDEG